MTSLAQQRCLRHPDRAAVARCPACRRFFCRECITDHDGRALCADCLSPGRPGRPRRRPGTGLAWQGLASGLGLVVSWAVFYLLGRLLLLLPSLFHAGSRGGGG